MKRGLFTSSTVLLLLSFLFPYSLCAQTHVSQEWTQISSTSGGRDGGGSVSIPGGGVIRTGSENEQIAVTRLSSSGAVVWNYLHPATSPSSGARVIVDSAGSLGVIALQELDSLGYEAVVLKIDSTGILDWAASYSNSHDDIPVDLDFDSNGNTYVAVASKNGSGNYDFSLVKYDTSGTQIWNSYYDFAGLDDIPVSVHINPSGGVIVSGCSQDSTGTYQFTTVRFDDSGTLDGATRIPTSIGTPEQTTSAYQDSTGNLYLTGRSGVPGANTDIKLVKLNTSYSIDWTVTYDANGLDDIGADIFVDNGGDVVVSGQVSTLSGHQQSILLKYNTSGTLIWEQEISSANGTVNNEPRSLSIGQDNSISIVTSEVDDSLQPTYSMIRQYTEDGDLLWGRPVGTMGTKPRSVTFDTDGSIYVTSIEPDTTISTIHYTLLKMDSSAVYDSDSIALFKSHELVVRFDVYAIDTAHINEAVDKGIEFADLSYFLTDAAMGAIDTALTDYCYPSSRGHNACGIQAVRIFKTMRTTDTLTFSKSGDSLRIPDFYTMLLLKLPDNFELWGTHTALETLPQYIAYSEPNFIVHTQSNDPEYQYQASLHYTPVQPNDTTADVNVEPAWDIYPEAGNKAIRVAVFDEGLNFRHVDFGYVNTDPNSGKMVDGWDYQTDVNLKTLQTPDDYHGTPVAGIIGARKDDGVGIAGIAGGNVALDDSSGVSLFGVRVIQGQTETNPLYNNPITYMYDAFVNSCMPLTSTNFNPRYFNVDIINCSWVINTASPQWSDSSFNALREGVKFANDMGVTVVAAMGNTDNANRANYPANLTDNWVISVGGSDAHGEYYNEQSFKACWGGNIDLIAPMDIHLVVTDSCASNNHAHQNFNGTSAAAPHVTGAVALMKSYHRPINNDYQLLAPEDCERLLELSATDVGDTLYDTLTGWGRLNIGNAMALLQEPEYQLIHFGTNGASNSTFTSTFTQIDTLFPIQLTETFQQNNTLNNNPWYHSGNYLADVWKIEFTIDHVLPTGYSIITGWPVHSASKSFFFPVGSTVTPQHYIILNTYNNTYAHLTAYTYKVYDTLGNFIAWWPTDPGQVNAKYTLLLQANTAGIEELSASSSIKLYPNPTNGQHEMQFNGHSGEELKIDLYSIDGRFIGHAYQGVADSDKFSLSFNVNALPSGMYLYAIDKNSGDETIRFIRQ